MATGINHDVEFGKLIKKLKDQSIPDSPTEKELKKIGWSVDMIRKIDDQYIEIKNNNSDAFDYYFGANYMEDVAGHSQVYTRDLMETVEWIMPALMKIFAGGDDVTSLAPRKKEHAEQVKNHNELINYQLRIKNKWFDTLNSWFRDALLLKRGAVKYQWYKEVKEEERYFQGMNEAELQFHLSDPTVKKVDVKAENIIQPESYVHIGLDMDGLPVNKTIPAVKSYDGTLFYEIKDEYPLIESVPSEEFGFPVDTRDIENCQFFYHRVKYSKASFINKFGEASFNKVRDLKNTFMSTGDDYSVEFKRFEDIGSAALNFFYDNADNQWLVYECYFEDEDDGTPWFQAICGNVLLRDEKNEYKKPPFEIITPIKLAHRVIGSSLFDLLKDLQRIRTALMRQMLDNVYYNNNGRSIIDPTRVSYEDFLNANRPGGTIRTLDGQPANAEAVFPLPTPQLQPWAFEVLEMVNKEKDYIGGVPRSFQGVNSQILNRTVRGQNQQIQQATQRVEMMARLFAEMGIAPLIRDVVDMNDRFMTQQVAVKVVDNWIDVTPDDVVAKADVIINVGLGTTSKDVLVQQGQQIIALYMQLYQIFGQSLNKPILHALEELIKSMGYRDTQNWVPGEEEMQQALAMMQQAQMAKEQGGKNSKGTATGQETNPQGVQPANPLNPSLEIPEINGQNF
jgi:hypothetical protein